MRRHSTSSILLTAIMALSAGVAAGQSDPLGDDNSPHCA